MAREVKCQYCGEYETQENMVFIEVGKTKKQKKYYHKECLETKERNTEEYKNLIEYICELFDMEAPNGMIVKQIKEYHTDYKYRYYAIQLALQYFFVIKENNIPDYKTIGIVPFIMEEAKEYYTRISTMSVEDFEIRSVTTSIKQPKKINRKKKIINISEL